MPPFTGGIAFWGGVRVLGRDENGRLGQMAGRRQRLEISSAASLAELNLPHVSRAPTTLPGNGPTRKSVWRLVIPVAVLALLIGTTLGEVWHRHVNTSAENCPICHLSHQAAEPAVATARAELLVPEGAGPEPQRSSFLPLLDAPRVPARAPPA